MPARRSSRAGWRTRSRIRRWSRSSSETRMLHSPPPPLLEVSGIAAGYRRMQVLWGVDLTIHAHESVVLLGANGAGKTTLLKAIMSLIEVWAGRVAFGGEDITGLRPDQRVRRGIVFMSETSGFPGLSIDENILIGAQFLPKPRARTDGGTLCGVSRAWRAPARPRRQPLRRAAQNARHRQGVGRRAAPPSHGRAVGRPVAAL